MDAQDTEQQQTVSGICSIGEYLGRPVPLPQSCGLIEEGQDAVAEGWLPESAPLGLASWAVSLQGYCVT